MLLIAVVPAHIYLVQSAEAQAALGTSPVVAMGRLPFQFLFMGASLMGLPETDVQTFSP